MDVPTTPARIPLSKFWISVLAPGIGTALVCIIIARINEGQPNHYGSNYLFVPLFTLPLIIGFSVLFVKAVNAVYRPVPVLIMLFFYVVLQLAIGTSIWLGSCKGWFEAGTR